MSLSRIYEGTWEQIKAQESAFRSAPRLTLIVPEESVSKGLFRADMTSEERIRAMDAFTRQNEGLPLLSDDAFDRENLYADDDRIH